jgi:hypothetical protein
MICTNLTEYADKMAASLDNRFDVHGVVKPGSANGSIRETVKGDVDQLTVNEFLAACSGTNGNDRTIYALRTSQI